MQGIPWNYKFSMGFNFAINYYQYQEITVNTT